MFFEFVRRADEREYCPLTMACVFAAHVWISNYCLLIGGEIKISLDRPLFGRVPIGNR